MSSPGHGGPRPNSGRKPKVIHQVILRETQPGRYEQIADATDADLTPLAVMMENMKFFHRKAGELMAVIMQSADAHQGRGDGRPGASAQGHGRPAAHAGDGADVRT